MAAPAQPPEILGLTPARGGSKGVPRKNLALLDGKPLIAHTALAALESKLLTRRLVTTDDPEILETATAWGLEGPFLRPAALAQDDTPALPVIQHAVRWLEEHEGYVPDYICLLQPTSPLRTARHIDEAMSALVHSQADSVVSVVQAPHNMTPVSIMQLREGLLVPFMPRDETENLRQRKPVFYARNGAAIYGFTRRCLVEKRSLYGDAILPYEMQPDESVDVDEPFDLELCQWLLERQRQHERRRAADMEGSARS